MHKILIVEDEDDLRQVLMETLSDLGFEAHGVSDATTALRKIEGDLFHLVLSDIQMPGMNGIELLATLRRRQINLPVIILSAYSDKEKIKAASEYGVFDFLEKPFSMSALTNAIERAVHGRD